jgi:hypothetical protein
MVILIVGVGLGGGCWAKARDNGAARRNSHTHAMAAGEGFMAA